VSWNSTHGTKTGHRSHNATMEEGTPAQRRGEDLLDPLDDHSVMIKPRLVAGGFSSRVVPLNAADASDIVAYLDWYESSPYGPLRILHMRGALEVEGARVIFEALPRFENLTTLNSTMPLVEPPSEEPNRDVDAHPVGEIVPIISAAIPKLKALREFYISDFEWGISLAAFLMLMKAFEGHPRINHIDFMRSNLKSLKREAVDEMLRVFETCPRLRFIRVDYEGEELETYAAAAIDRLWGVKNKTFKEERAKRARTA